MTNTKYYRAADLYSRPAYRGKPARPGVLPIGPTQFYSLLKQGKFPDADAQIGCVRMWTDELVRSTMLPSTPES